MAIVLVIIGLIAAGALKAASAIRENTGISETAKAMDTVVTALRTFLVHNNRLPCPALATLPETDPKYVVEARTDGNCDASTQVGGSNAHRGVLPVRNLGLSRLLDAWDRQFTYGVILQATQSNSFTSKAWPPTFGLQDESETNLMPNGNGVVVIISHGANGSGAYLANGKQMDPPTAVNELENVVTDDLIFVSAAYSNDDTNPFDDHLLVLTEDQIVQPLADQGALKTKKTLALATIRTTQDAILGAAMAGRTETTANNISYPLPTTIPAGILATDPWGTPINYAPDPAVINPGITQTGPPGIDDAYTIQSNGPNTADNGGTLDDIVFTVTVVELRGIFTKTGF